MAATALALAALLGSGAGAAAAAAPPKPTIEVAPGIFLASFSEFGMEPAGPSPPQASPQLAEGGEGPTAGTSVVGGSKTNISRWPWQVEISTRLNPFKQPRKRHHCGGTLLAPTIVVTAAHCMTLGRGEFTWGPGQFFTRLGLTKLNSNQGTRHELADYYWFVDANGDPLWNAKTVAWDVVFLELEEPSDQRTIKIAGEGEELVWGPGQRAFVTGWGTTRAGTDDEQRDLASFHLRMGRILMLSDSACEDVYGPILIPSLMVCAGLPGGGVDACSGDSGGPLVVPIAGRKRYRLIGDVSFGAGCGLPGVPGAYGRLASNPIREALAGGIAYVAGAGTSVVGAGTAQPPSGFTFGRVRNRGRAITARLPGPGQVRVEGTRQLREWSSQPTRAGATRARIIPRGKLRRRLRRGGSASTRVKVTYTPLNGSSRTASKRVRLQSR